MGKVKVVTTEESYIRTLPFSAFRKLFNILDPGKEWEKLAVFIPKRLDMTDEDFEPRYSYQTITLYAERGNKPNGSATEALLADWATQNARIKHLIAALVKAELYAAADYLSVKILNKGPVPRKSVTEEVYSNDFNNLRTSDIDLPVPFRLTGDGQLLKPYQRHPSSQPEEHKEEGYDEQDQDSRTAVIDKTESAAGSIEAEHLSYGSSKISEGVMAECDSVEIQKIEQASESIESMLTSSKVFIQNMKYGMLKMITNCFDETELTQKGRLIGKGGFGTVFLGKFKNGFQVAVKCLIDDKTMDIDKQFENELRCLSEYRHINLVHLLGFSNDGPCKCIVYQYISNGSLEDRIMCKDNTPPLPACVRVTIAKGTAEGIAFLNVRDMVHRDIKSANVLLDSDFVPKVADFGTVRSSAPQGSGFSAVQSTNVVIGTSAYLAPEAIQGDVSTKLDSYGFGVILLELLTGLPPFDSEREEKDIKSYMDENCEDILMMVDRSAGEWDKKTVNTLYDVALRCLEHKKKKRPTVSDVLKDLRNLSDTLKSGD